MKEPSFSRLGPRRVRGGSCRSDFARRHLEEPENEPCRHLSLRPLSSLGKGPVLNHALHGMVMPLRTPFVWDSFSVFPDFPDLECCDNYRPLIFGMFRKVGFLMFPLSEIQVVHL